MSKQVTRVETALGIIETTTQIRLLAKCGHHDTFAYYCGTRCSDCVASPVMDKRGAS